MTDSSVGDDPKENTILLNLTEVNFGAESHDHNHEVSCAIFSLAESHRNNERTLEAVDIANLIIRVT